jgi:hypothetical protein
MHNPLNMNLLSLMKPKPSPYPLIRIGGDRDGGYLLPDDLEGIEACFSPGVNNYKYFEDELTGVYGIRCHMCDYSSDESKFRSPLVSGMQTFDKKWLDIDGSPDSFSLGEWVQTYSPLGGDLLLQMDIEGAEYRNLLSSSTALLNRFRIIVIELHGLRAFLRKDLPSKEIGPLLLKLDQTHICIHAHPNNCCGEYLDEETGLNFPGVIELTLLRRDRFQVESLIPPQVPHPLDISRNARGKKPIYLNELWQHPYPRTLKSEIKVLEDELAYKRWLLHSREKS